MDDILSEYQKNQGMAYELSDEKILELRYSIQKKFTTGIKLNLNIIEDIIKILIGTDITQAYIFTFNNVFQTIKSLLDHIDITFDLIHEISLGNYIILLTEDSINMIHDVTIDLYNQNLLMPDISESELNIFKNHVVWFRTYNFNKSNIPLSEIEKYISFYPSDELNDYIQRYILQKLEISDTMTSKIEKILSRLELKIPDLKEKIKFIMSIYIKQYDAHTGFLCNMYYNSHQMFSLDEILLSEKIISYVVNKIASNTVSLKRKPLPLPEIKNNIPILPYCDSELSESFRQAIFMRTGQRLKSMDLLGKSGISGTGKLLLNLDFINNFKSLFLFESDCLCRPLRGTAKSTDVIKKIRQFGKGNAGVAYKIEIKEQIDGRQVSRDYIAKTVPITPSSLPDYIKLELYRFASLDRTIMDNIPSLFYNCFKFSDGTEGIINAKFDNNFYNQSCMHLILNRILEPYKIKNYIYQYDAFVCGDLGVNIMDIAEYGDLSNYLDNLEDDKITDDLLFDIVRQVLNPLSILKCNQYGFVHADLKCKNVFVGKSATGPVFKIADYDKSSIFWNGVRFSLKSVAVDALLSPYTIERIFNTKAYDLTSKGNLVTVQALTMYSYIPMYMSYDVYTFILSMIREPKILKQFKNGREFKKQFPKFTKILSLLFDYGDGEHGLSKIFTEMETWKKEIEIIRDKNPEAKASYIIEMRALGYINMLLASNNYKLKINIDSLYYFLDLFAPSDYDEMKVFYPNPIVIANRDSGFLGKIAGLDVICVDECKNSKCNTNKYDSGTLFKGKVVDSGSC